MAMNLKLKRLYVRAPRLVWRACVHIVSHCLLPFFASTGVQAVDQLIYKFLIKITYIRRISYIDLRIFLDSLPAPLVAMLPGDNSTMPDFYRV